jgi:hypothetical protein
MPSDTSYVFLDGLTMGPTGPTGPTGPADSSAALAPSWTYSSTTTDADPGEGVFRLNTTDSSATFIYVADEEAAAVDWSDMILEMGASSFVLIQQEGTLARYLCRVTGALTDASGYVKIPITVVSTQGGVGFTNEVACSFGFYK